MVDDGDNEKGKKSDEDKTDAFTPEGEALGYISLDQGRVLAMRTARDEPGDYGRQFRNIRMAFEVVETEETEDHYVITLSFRPEGRFAGTPGHEQFFIEKEGAVAHRQVLSLPERRGWRRLPAVPIAVGVVAIVIVVVLVVIFSGGGGGEVPIATVDSTSTLTPLPTPQAEPRPAATGTPPGVPTEATSTQLPSDSYGYTSASDTDTVTCASDTDASGPIYTGTNGKDAGQTRGQIGCVTYRYVCADAISAVDRH